MFARMARKPFTENNNWFAIFIKIFIPHYQALKKFFAFFCNFFAKIHYICNVNG